MTAVAGSVFTAAQFNQHVRDNLLETAPAKATTAGGYFVATGTNAIVQRVRGNTYVDAFETTTSTSYVGLTTAVAVTVTTGTSAVVMWGSNMRNNTAAQYCYTSIAVSGATTTVAADATAINCDLSAIDEEVQVGNSAVFTLNAGSNTFTMKHRVQAGTGRFGRRSLIVLPF